MSQRAPATPGSTPDWSWVALMRPIGLFGVLVAVAIVLQWNGGAFTGAFLSDAAAHYVTGLALHDWLLAGVPNPIRYVIDYHAHLPLTAFGLWPPLFHGVEAIWMLVAGTGKANVVLLSGVVTAAMGVAVAAAAARSAGWLAGAAAGLILVINPLVQRASAEIMIDVPCAFASFLAALAYARFLTRGTLASALGFAVLAVAAMLVKYNAVALALVPPLCVLIARRWDLLLRPAFYVPAVVVAVAIGPLYLKTAGLAQQGFQFSWGWTYLSLAAPFNAASLVEGLTPLAAALAFVGLVRVLCHGHRRDKVSTIEVACAALAIATFVFLLAVPIALQDRYLIPCVPPLLVLAACEGARLVRPVLRIGTAGLVMIGALAVALPPQAAPQDPLSRVMPLVQAALPHENSVVLMVGDGTLEPAMIAEFAEIQPQRPDAWAIRGSRLLGGGGYNNADYKPRFATTAEVMTEIDRYGVAVILLHRTKRANAWAHIGQVAELVDKMPDWARHVGRIEGGAPLDIFVIPANATRVPDAAALTELSGPRALIRLTQPSPQ